MPETPAIFQDFASYQLTIRNRSKGTVKQYISDLTLFYKYVICTRSGKNPEIEEDFDSAGISLVDLDLCRSIRTEEIHSFILYSSMHRGNKPAALCRKISALKTFYKFLTVTKSYFKENPTSNIEPPKTKTALPKYLTLEESIDLLNAVSNDTQSKTRERDFCMITLFLNCGIRLSELCGISLQDIDPNLKSMRVIGKGSKERIVYLNDACRDAMTEYISKREHVEKKDKYALFLSSRGIRISQRTVEHIIYKYLDMAGLGYRHFSVHKLRHTAATLMYQEGGVDIRVLKDILGHESLNTTQIYTHVSNKHMEDAINKNPLANVRKKSNNKKNT